MIALLAASLFLTDPLPLDMPRATAYLVTEKGEKGVRRQRLEDRFTKADLWVSRSVDGRWMDDDGRVFVMAHLDVLPPDGAAEEATVTRTEYLATRVTIGRRDKAAVRAALAKLSPVELPEKETRPRQLPRGYKDVDYWHGTNETAIVCAYLPEEEKVWRLATWELAEGDDFADALQLFEKEFLGREALVSLHPVPAVKTSAKAKPAERELLRADARHAVAAYENWRVTDSESFMVLDDLPTRDFAVTLTNDLAVMRRRYAESLPTPIEGSNVLALVRIYATRGEYLEALSASGLTNMAWSAAYWSPRRRELVAHADGSQNLLETLRHEAFHQYLSYATCFLPTSPWLNEGYAQYFENENSLDWELAEGKPSIDELERFSLLLPALFAMDYEEFYAGSDLERRIKYRLAWSLIVFLEKGASEVRFEPFKDLKRDYLDALFKTKDPLKATAAAFKNKGDLQKKFIGEWLAYWKSH